MNLSQIITTITTTMLNEGVNTATVEVGKACLMFWDLGLEELQSLWDKYRAECHVVFCVTDSTDERRLSESKQAFKKVVWSEYLDNALSWCWLTNRMWRSAS